MSMEICPFCGLPAYEVVNPTVWVPNCCAPGNLMYEHGYAYNDLLAIMLLEFCVALYIGDLRYARLLKL